MVCWVQQAWGCCGGWRISGRSRSRVIDAGAERAADLARGGGARDAVVAVGVVSGEAAELVAGELSGAGVVRGGVFGGGAAGERPEFQQRARRLSGSTGCRWR